MAENNGNRKIKYISPRSSWKIYLKLIWDILTFPKFLRPSRLSPTDAKDLAGFLWIFAGIMVAFFGMSLHSALGLCIFIFGVFIICPLGAIHHFKRGYRRADC